MIKLQKLYKRCSAYSLGFYPIQRVVYGNNANVHYSACEYLPNSIDGTAIRIQFKISGLSKIKDILTEINEEGKHDRNDGFKTASKASQFDFLD